MHTLNFGGLDRSYRLYIPDGLASPAPLVVMMHGGFGSAQQAERAYGWDELADSAKFVVAYPDGVGRAWNVNGGCCGRPGRENIDDVGFITAGISNGGMMAYALACNSRHLRRDRSRLGHPTRRLRRAAPDIGDAHPRHRRSGYRVTTPDVGCQSDRLRAQRRPGHRGRRGTRVAARSPLRRTALRRLLQFVRRTARSRGRVCLQTWSPAQYYICCAAVGKM